MAGDEQPNLVPSNAPVPPRREVADGSYSFECNICLDHVKEPVVTLCGHLYCWSCLYRWISRNNQCPVCKAGVTQENVIPVYGRGSSAADPRKHTSHLDDDVPDRPRGQRPEPVQRRSRFALGLDTMQDMGFSPIIGFFPSLFGLQFQPAAHPVAVAPTGAASEAEAQQRVQHIFLSRLLMVLGTLVLLSLILF